MTTPSEIIREAITRVLAAWEDNHADWCCANGCGHPTGHATPEAVHEWMRALGAGEVPGPLAVEACDGTCNCDVGLYTSQLRAALAEVPE